MIFSALLVCSLISEKFTASVFLVMVYGSWLRTRSCIVELLKSIPRYPSPSCGGHSYFQLVRSPWQPWVFTILFWITHLLRQYTSLCILFCWVCGFTFFQNKFLSSTNCGNPNEMCDDSPIAKTSCAKKGDLCWRKAVNLPFTSFSTTQATPVRRLLVTNLFSTILVWF